MALFPQITITTDAALRDLASDKPRVRAAAAVALGGVEPERAAEAAGALIRAVDDGDFDVRASAILSLGELGDQRAVAPLVKRLDDGAPSVRQNAAIALGASIGRRVRAARGARWPRARPTCASRPRPRSPRSIRRARSSRSSPRSPTAIRRSSAPLRSRSARSATRPRSSRWRRGSITRCRRPVRRRVRARRARRPRAVETLVGAATDRERAGTRSPRSSGSARRRSPGAICIERVPDHEHAARRRALLAVAPEHAAADRARDALEASLSGGAPSRGLAIEQLGEVGGDVGDAAARARRRRPPAAARRIRSRSCARSGEPHHDDRVPLSRLARHVDGPEFDADRDEVLARARAAGVSAMVVIGAVGDPTSAERPVALAERDPNVWATVATTRTTSRR